MHIHFLATSFKKKFCVQKFIKNIASKKDHRNCVPSLSNFYLYFEEKKIWTNLSLIRLDHTLGRHYEQILCASHKYIYLTSDHMYTPRYILKHLFTKICTFYQIFILFDNNFFFLFKLKKIRNYATCTNTVLKSVLTDFTNYG